MRFRYSLRNWLVALAIVAVGLVLVKNLGRCEEFTYGVFGLYYLALLLGVVLVKMP